MNWTEITQSKNDLLWHISDIKLFPQNQSELFLGYGVGNPLGNIVFSGSQFIIAFWAVAAKEPISATILYQSGEWFAQGTQQQARADLKTRFPEISHAEHSGFTFNVNLDHSQTELPFDIYLNIGEEWIWFASFTVTQYSSSAEVATSLNMPNQLQFLRLWAGRKNSAELVAKSCAEVIDLSGEKTAPGIYAVLGDALESLNKIEPAINAYSTAVELQPQESKFEMRLSQLLAKRVQLAAPTSGQPKGISLSTSGDTALTIIVDMLYRSTPAYMYARELFQNELDAIYRRWDYELKTQGDSDFVGIIRIEPATDNPKKLCFWGDGIGMTFDQVTNHLAKLVNSGNVSHTATNYSEPASPSNFGIGAKTSALPENTQGMVYKTLPFGESEGIEFTLWKNPNTFLYEIKGWNNGENTEYFRRIPVKQFVDPIQQRGSGTLATLLGNTPEENTFEKSENLLTRQVAKEQIRRGIIYFLNSRYYAIAASGIDAQVAERNADGSLNWHRVIGQKAFLERYEEQSGMLIVRSGDLYATAYWWILSEDAKKDSSLFNTLGHVGLLWKNELYYNPNESQRIQRLQLNGFGIHFGEERVIIYIQPNQPDAVDSHPSRTKLMYKHRELNASEFGEDFAAHLPSELEAYQKSFFSSGITEESIEKIREHLQSLGLDKDAKMRQYAASYFNRGKLKSKPDPAVPPAVINAESTSDKPEAIKPETIIADTFRSHIPNCVWRSFDAETILFAAEWDISGYVIKFNSAWPHYLKTLHLLQTEAQSDFPNMAINLLQEECEQLLRFEYFKTIVENLFSCYSMMEYSGWTDRMIENQLLSPAGLSITLQFNSNMRNNIKTALANQFIDKEEPVKYGLKAIS